MRLHGCLCTDKLEREITCLCQLMHTHVSVGALVPLCVRCVLVFNLNNLPLSFTRVFLFRSFFFLYSFFFSIDMCVRVCGYVWLFCVCVCGGGGGFVPFIAFFSCFRFLSSSLFPARSKQPLSLSLSLCPCQSVSVLLSTPFPSLYKCVRACIDELERKRRESRKKYI